MPALNNQSLCEETASLTIRSPDSAAWLPNIHRQLLALSKLPLDWDSYGASPPDIQVIEALLQEANYIAIKLPMSPMPSVVPLGDGGIELEWEFGEDAVVLTCQKDRGLFLYSCIEGEDDEKPAERANLVKAVSQISL